jgi:hypothetical protein
MTGCLDRDNLSFGISCGRIHVNPSHRERLAVVLFLPNGLVYVRGAVECRSLRVCVCGIVIGLDEQLNALTIGENEGLRPRSGIEGVARKTAPRLTRPWALSQWTQSLPRTRMRPC